MPNPISESDLESVISNFNSNIVEYEIIDMDKYQGWSSAYLYLLVCADDNYILKAKTPEQISGYDNEVKVCNALIANGIEARRPILTKSGEIFHQQCGYYWNLMTYISGAQSHVNEYEKSTVSTLAEHINEYVSASLSNESLKNLDLCQTTQKNGVDTLDQLITEKELLEKNSILEISDILDLYKSLKTGYESTLNKLDIRSIIHNDINPRNILIDHKSRNVISLIDWDHVKYGNPLKDVSDAVSIFYDFLPFEKAGEYRKLFNESIKAEWFKNINPKTVDFALLFYYTIAKWKSILFYLDLLKRFDNKYGEEERFINEMKNSYEKWQNMIKSVSI